MRQLTAEQREDLERRYWALAEATRDLLSDGGAIAEDALAVYADTAAERAQRDRLLLALRNVRDDVRAAAGEAAAARRRGDLRAAVERATDAAVAARDTFRVIDSFAQRTRIARLMRRYGFDDLMRGIDTAIESAGEAAAAVVGGGVGALLFVVGLVVAASALGGGR